MESALNTFFSIQPNCLQIDKFNLFYKDLRTTWLDDSKFTPLLRRHFEPEKKTGIIKSVKRCFFLTP